jgi:uncharacterized RDD family membrane protein YckC
MAALEESPTASAALDDELITGEAVALDVRPTGFVLRGAGAAIDFLVYLGLWFLLVVFVLSSPLFQLLFDSAMLQAGSIAALVLCTVVLPTTVELATRGRSLGKLAVGARIVRDDGGAIGFRHAFIRALLGAVEIFGTLGGIAALVALFNTKAKRLGDLLAGTYSQNERISRYSPPAYGVPLELVEWSRVADVARMPDPLARRIAQFLAGVGGFTPESRMRVANGLAREAAPYVSPVPPADPELFLAAIAAMRRDREFAALMGERSRLATLEPVLDRLPHDFPDR